MYLYISKPLWEMGHSLYSLFIPFIQMINVKWFPLKWLTLVLKYGKRFRKLMQ